MGDPALKLSGYEIAVGHVLARGAGAHWRLRARTIGCYW
jgi:hypothetical protein